MSDVPSSMDLNRRQQEILTLVQRHGFVSNEELAQSFNVTPQTIRRDINRLCLEGLLRRYHGGAGLPSNVENVAYTARQVLCLDEKGRIAKTVARHIPDQASLFINIGTTTEEVAKALRGHEGLRIITNNLNVALLMSGNPSLRSSSPPAPSAPATRASRERRPWTSSSSSRSTSASSASPALTTTARFWTSITGRCG